MNRKKQLYQIAVRKNTLRMKWETLETDLGLSQPSVRIGIRSALIALFARHRLHIADLGQQQFSSCQYMFFPVVDVVCFCPAYGLFFILIASLFFLLPVLRWFLSSRGDVLTSYSSLVVWVHWFVVVCHLLFSVTLPAFVFDIVSP